MSEVANKIIDGYMDIIDEKTVTGRLINVIEIYIEKMKNINSKYPTLPLDELNELTCYFDYIYRIILALSKLGSILTVKTFSLLDEMV